MYIYIYIYMFILVQFLNMSHFYDKKPTIVQIDTQSNLKKYLIL